MKKIRRYISLFFAVVSAAAMIQQLSRPVDERDWHGDVLGIPYDFRPLTPARIRERWWNPDDSRIFTPHVFGVGWSLNLYQLRHQLVRPARTNGDG